MTAGDGVRLWYTNTGLGPPIVLCHGGPGMWDYLAPLAALVDDRATVTRYDQRGCGRSDRAGPYSVARGVTDLDELRAHLGVDRWVVGGHSWGATLALHYAFAHQASTSAVLYLSGVGIGRAWSAAYHEEAGRRRTADERRRHAELAAMQTRSPAEEHAYRVLNWFPDYVPGPRARALAAELADATFSINTEANRTLGAETKTWQEAELAARAASLRVPVLIVHGRLDPRPTWAIDTLAAALPNGSVHKLVGVGHLPWIEDPAATAACLRAFLAGL